jgi:peptidoglycan/LPS O-acetylase OafA/YrhL
MKTWVRRIRGAVGMGVTWALAGGATGTLINLGFLARAGSPPDAPFPIMLTAAGFFAGLLFSGVLTLVAGRRRFEELSLARFAASGAAVGFTLSAAFFLAVSRGDRTFLQYFVVVGPVVTIAAAGCAAGSLVLARRAQDRALLETRADASAVVLADGAAPKVLRNDR